MTSSLPERPSLERLRKQAKTILRSHRQRDPEVCNLLRRVHQFSNASDEEILQADVSLNQVQFALAMDYGFPSWNALKRHVEDGGRDTGLLHVFCLEVPADRLRESGVPGRVIVWQDPLIEGPAPADVSDAEWVRLRAENLAGDVFETLEQAEQSVINMDRRLEEFRNFDEVVLWFDACLYDQVILARHLDWFSRRDLGDTKLSLIVSAEYPGIESYHGLGQLHPEQVATLLDTRQQVTPEQMQLGAEAWRAYRSPDPTAIEALLGRDSSPLPHLAAVLSRHLERFPSVRNGLSRLENEALEVLTAGPRSFADVFECLSDLERPAFFGFSLLFGHLQYLATGDVPLLALQPPDDSDQPGSDRAMLKTLCEITDSGRDVLAGSVDQIELNSIDRWLGGVYLHGHEIEWRWDESQRRLARTA